jgi:hypothetical protein
VGGAARGLRGRLEERRDRFGARVSETRDRASELGGELTKRVEPIVDQARGTLVEVPQQLARAVEPVAARVRSLVTSAA